MTEITGLAGVIIHTGNFDGLLAFYRDTLGLTPRGVKPGFVNFDWNGVRLTITEHSGIAGASRDGLRVVVNFTTEDIGEAHLRLVAAGVPCLREPSPERWGLVSTYLDPDGNAFQLFQFSTEAAHEGQAQEQ